MLTCCDDVVREGRLSGVGFHEWDVATAEDIDTAMEPDVVGLDVRLVIAEQLAQEVGARFTPPAVLWDRVAAGHLGRGSGQEFHNW